MASSMVSWLYGLQHFGVKLGLDNIRRLLDVLGHPQRSYPCVLIGGSNGKGSVAAMLASMLEAHGKRTGLFTSPHLVRPNERIRIAGKDITDDAFDRQLARMRHCIEAAVSDGRLEAHPSFFEVITATALASFNDQNVDAAVLEVGLGGRLDATNAVDAELSVIVSIDLDHVKTLGGTITNIATEKAGIIKPQRPIISGVTQQKAWKVLQRTCAQREATLIDARTAVRFIREDERSCDFAGRRGSYTGLNLPLTGRHQIDNARVALAALETLAQRRNWSLSDDAIKRGLRDVRWPGRLQWIKSAGTRFLLDAAHNPAGMSALARFLDQLDPQSPKPVLLFGVTRGKPVAELLNALAARATQVILTRPPVDKGIDPVDVEPIARNLFDQVEIVEPYTEAIERARAIAGKQRFILVTGSLYLVGDVLGQLTDQRSPGSIAM